MVKLGRGFLRVALGLHLSEGMLWQRKTYLALLRRGIDDTTAQQLADAGLKIGDLKKIDRNMLIENYGLKADIADGVISIINLAILHTAREIPCIGFGPRKES